LLPHATHLPSSLKFQFLATGVQAKSARRKKVVPHRAVRMIMPQLSVRATLFCMSNRRRYWKRIESLMKVVLAVYVVFVDQIA